MSKRTVQKDLTEGIIWKQLLLFALPLLGSSFIQQLYNTVDLLFAGNLIGKEATAAVGASSLVISCLVGFFTGLSVGVGVIVSQAIGAGNIRKVDQTIHTAMALSLSGGAVLSVFGIALARIVLVWMNTPPEILDSAVSYVRIYMLSMIPVVTYNMNAGIIRATGNSNIPMLIQLTGAVINIVTDYISIRYASLGVDGVAWATLFSQGAAAVLSILYLMRKENPYPFKWRRIHISRDILKEVLFIGIPAGMQNLVITLSNIFVQHAVNGFGVDAIAAFASYFKIELLNYLPIVAFGQAMMTFSGQNTGAEKYERVKKGAIICIVMGTGYVICSAGLLLLFGETVFGLFHRDSAVISYGMHIMRITFPLYWLYVILEVLADAIRGAGQSLASMVIILVNICILRTVFLIVLMQYSKTVETVTIIYPLTWLTTAICFILYWKSRKWIPKTEK